MRTEDRLFETVNGAWLLLTSIFVVFLVLYLVIEWHRYRPGWLGWRFTLGMQVAVSLLVTDVGTIVSRFGAWHWRHLTGGLGPLSSLDGALLVVGAGIAAVGIVCQIRIFSRPYVGHWPWMMAAALALAYVIVATGY